MSGHNEYYRREQELNKKIREFQSKYYDSNLLTHSHYHEMDLLRREIKHLLNLQSYQVWQKSYNRKHAYFDQLTLFKSMYMLWKKATFSPTLRSTMRYRTTSQCGQRMLAQNGFREVFLEPNFFIF